MGHPTTPKRRDDDQAGTQKTWRVRVCASRYAPGCVAPVPAHCLPRHIATPAQDDCVQRIVAAGCGASSARQQQERGLVRQRRRNAMLHQPTHAPPGTPAATTPGTSRVPSASSLCSSGSTGTPASSPMRLFERAQRARASEMITVNRCGRHQRAATPQQHVSHALQIRAREPERRVQPRQSLRNRRSRHVTPL